MANTPFTYGRLVFGKEFTNRKVEAERLAQNFAGNINTILISPRRWGKSSLVQRAADVAKKQDQDLRVCFIDLFNIRSEGEFYQALAAAVLKSTTSKLEEVVSDIRTFFKYLIPKLSISPDAVQEVSLTLDWEEAKKHPDELLNLAENVAKQKGLHLIICIDEFRNIGYFDDPLAFQKKLRAHWQQHRHVTYCLYGSKRHMMMEVFASPSMPFYKFGDLMFLEKIKREDWIKFIKERFKSTGKKINADNAGLIAELAECHPYYVQQLAQLSWLRSEQECTETLVREATEALLHQLSMLFQSITEGLSNSQINFLQAILDKVEHLSGQETLKKYRLGSSGNVGRVKQALKDKEVIDQFGEEIVLLDPMYRHWLERYYFNQS